MTRNILCKCDNAKTPILNLKLRASIKFKFYKYTGKNNLITHFKYLLENFEDCDDKRYLHILNGKQHTAKQAN